MKRLGIDLGSNSLGWAIYDSSISNYFSDAGVVVFDEGIKREKGADSLETPAAERRKYRMARRLKFRRKLRKHHVLKLLIQKSMCPLSLDELTAWKKEDIYPVSNQAFMDWLKSTPNDNPYADRKACVEVKVSPEILGRAIYHLAQRRGFRSSRKDAAHVGDDAADPQNNKAADTGTVKSSINELTRELEKRNCTLGQYFFERNQRNDKVRNHYIGRNEHYLKEFNKIVEVQSLDVCFANDLRHALFSQRPLRSQKGLVGKCVLEKSRSRCMISHPLFEEFRMLSFVNTIRIITDDARIPLDAEQRRLACKAFFRKTPGFDFERIRIEVFGRRSNTELNYPDKTTVSSCTISHQINEVLGTDFHDWTTVGTSASGERVTYNYQTVFDALTFYDDDAKLKTFATNRLGLDSAAADKLVAIHVRDGFAAYSLFALKKILPFLREGNILSEAVFLAKLPDVLGSAQFEQNKDAILKAISALSASYNDNKKAASANQNVKVVPLHKMLKAYLENHWSVNEEGWDKLYLHTEGSSYDRLTGIETLPIVNLGMIRNPLVQRSLSILRRLVNNLRKSGKIDENTVINIELARSVNNRNTRLAIEQYQKELEAAHLDAVKEMEDLGIPSPSDDLVLKYLLWQEQGKVCLYTGKSIGISDLLNSDSAFDIEHTMPRSRSGDNSQSNKTVCDSRYNRDVKKGRLPSECPNYDEIVVRLKPWQDKEDNLKKQLFADKKRAKSIPADQPEMKAKAVQKSIVTRLKLDYWKNKCRFFTITADRVDAGFMNRQLVDTGIMSRHALDFLHSVYPKAYAVNGKATAWARKAWGIQGFYEPKSRINHTHHAIDAMVIAALDRDTFNKMCAAFKDDGVDHTAMFGPDESMLPFSNAVRVVSDAIIIKHLPRHNETKQTFRNHLKLPKALKLSSGKVIRKVRAAGDTVRGQLHKESFYGKILNPAADGSQQFVIRKPINDETTFKSDKDFSKIVDPAVSRTVAEQVAAYVAQGKKFKEAINCDLWMKPPSGDNPGVPIKKVRIVTTVVDPHPIRSHSHPSAKDYKNPYYVESGTGSNFKMAIYEQITTSRSGIVRRKIVPVVENLLDWAQNHAKPDYIAPEARTEDGRFLGFIMPGTLAIAYDRSPNELQALPQVALAKRIYRIVKFNAGDGRITLRFHAEARDAGSLSKTLARAAGESSIDFDNPHPLLLLSPGTYAEHFLFDGIHFDVSLAGAITFKPGEQK
jgi:CRISPR-associated endonuclease Csn1